MATSTTRKTAQPRRLASADRATGVTLNLDTYEFEGERPEPFVAVVGGKRLVFSDPMLMDWQDAADVNDPFELAEQCLSEADKKHFLEHRMPMHKLKKLVDAYQEHYGLGSPGNGEG